MDYAEGADTQVNKSEKCCNCIHQPKCDFSAEMDFWRPNYSCKKFKHVNDKTVYIVEPLCHGNGGWCGTEIVAEHPSLEDALKSRPRVRLEYSPYGGDVMNEPRLSPTKNINDATHIFAYEDGLWRWQTIDGEPVEAEVTKVTPMKPRKVNIDGTEVVIVGCGECPLIGRNDEMGDEWCQHPLTKDNDIAEENLPLFEMFPSWCVLKEVE
jgi:hypothetical protein